jgi:cyclophilin family peptidyl-prolyl cis-trans isomerase
MSSSLEKHGSEPELPLPDPDAIQRAARAAIERLRERRGFYIATGLFVVALVALVIVLRSGRRSEPPSDFQGIWNFCQPIRERLARGQSAGEYLEKLEKHVATLEKSRQEGYGLWFAALYRMREAWTAEKLDAAEQIPHMEKAIAHLLRLKEPRFDEFLLAKNHWFSGEGRTPIESALAQANSDLEWLKKNVLPSVSPASDVVAVLRTELGDVSLQFFPDFAPDHVSNFITLAKAGAYNGTKFHYLNGGRSLSTGVVAGDPYTFFYPDPLDRQQILRWGQGGPGYDLHPGEARFKIVHRRGIVSAQRRGERGSGDLDDGMQFQILTKPERSRDRIFTPFAQVVEGMEVVDRIATRKTAGEHETLKNDTEFTRVQTKDLFVEPVTVHKVLVYRNGTLDEGHAFDASEAEKQLSTLKNSPADPLPPEKIYGSRLLRETDAPGEIRRGLDFPFPADLDVKKLREGGGKPEFGARPDRPK